MDLIEQIKTGQGLQAVNTIKKVLNQKLAGAIQEKKVHVMDEVYPLDEINLQEAGTVDDYHRIATSHGYKKINQHTSPSVDPKTGAGGLYGGGITSHRYEHPSGSNVTIHQKPGLNRGDRERVSFTAGSSNAGGKHEWGKTPSGLEKHLNALHAVKESTDLAEAISPEHPSFKAGERSYNNTFRKTAKSLSQQERMNNHEFSKAHDKHIGSIGNLPEKLEAGRHFTAGYETAHAKHREDSRASMKEEIQNSNSSGQGYDPDHEKNPHHATILKHGYEYSHSTPVNYIAGRGIHHTYKHKTLKDHVVSVHEHPKYGGHIWDVHKLGQGSSFQGKGDANLDKHLKGHIARAKKKLGEEVELTESVPYPEKSKHLKDYKVITPKDDPNYEKQWELHHPEGHKLTWNRTDNTFTHTSPGVDKAKKGRMVDLHPHLMKVHNKFDDQVKEYQHNYGGEHGIAGQQKLHSLMGALEYRMKKAGYDGDREADAIRYKAMHAALMKMSKNDRGVR